MEWWIVAVRLTHHFIVSQYKRLTVPLKVAIGNVDILQ